MPYLTERETSYTNKCIVKEKSKLIHIKHDPKTILFITLHAWEEGEV